MSGEKFTQVQESFMNMIDELTVSDKFGIITFETTVKLWKNTIIEATMVNKNEAKAYVSGLIASGSTNFNEACLSAITLLSNDDIDSFSGIVVLLTDGVPTAGVTEPDIIKQNVKYANSEHEFSFFTLGFGKLGNDEDLNYDLLRDIAFENFGYDRRIYMGEDVTEQMEGFFEEIKSVLLKNVHLSYEILFPKSHVIISETTRLFFKNLFNGTEILVAGELTKYLPTPDFVVIFIEVNAWSASGDVTFSMTQNLTFSEHASVVDTEKIYVFKKIKDLIIDWRSVNGTKFYNKALNLALHHQLVTPITAIFVERLNTSKGNTNDDDDNGGGKFYDGEADDDGDDNFEILSSSLKVNVILIIYIVFVSLAVGFAIILLLSVGIFIFCKFVVFSKKTKRSRSYK